MINTLPEKIGQLITGSGVTNVSLSVMLGRGCRNSRSTLLALMLYCAFNYTLVDIF